MKLQLTLFVSFVLTFMNSMISLSQSDPSSTFVVAHRGASGYAPENTLAAVKLGWEMGATAVEIDVHLTLDNTVVVIHDKNTKRTAGKELIIATATYDQLKTLDVGRWKDEKYAGEQIPRLIDIVNAIPKGKKLVVEIKSDTKIVSVIGDELRNHPKVDRLIFIAFDYETIVETKKSFPSNKSFWLCSRFKTDIKSTLEKVKVDGLDGVDLNFRIIDREVMQNAKELGLEVHTWTVNDVDKAKELQELGISSITTDYPDRLLEIIR